MKKITLSLILAASILSGCKPYKEKVYEEVKSSQTAFVIPLQGDTGGQVKFDSEKFLESRKVAAKKIEIPLEEHSTGYFYGDVKYIPTIAVIKVDRAPITASWVSPEPGKGNGIWVESKDSIGYSTGFSISAYIKEENAAKFLYNYSNGSLEAVINSEVRARVQKNVAMVSAEYDIDVLRGKKNEILKTIESDVIPFFEAKGITITTIGQFGGFTYENKDIQVAIDKTFIAQQEKTIAAAQLAAQSDKNKRIEMEAIGLAEAAKTKAAGEAEGKLLVFKAEAEGKKMGFSAEANGISLVQDALAKANQNPQLIELKRIEVDMEKARRWNGSVPQWVWSEGAGKNTMFNLPLSTSK